MNLHELRSVFAGGARWRTSGPRTVLARHLARRHRPGRPRGAVAASRRWRCARRPAVRGLLRARAAATLARRCCDASEAVDRSWPGWTGRSRYRARARSLRPPGRARAPDRPDWWRNGGRDEPRLQGPRRDRVAEPRSAGSTSCSAARGARGRGRRSAASSTSGWPRSPTSSRSCCCRCRRATRSGSRRRSRSTPRACSAPVAERVFLHIGLPKTGDDVPPDDPVGHRDALRGEGLLLPGRGARDHLWACRIVARGPDTSARPTSTSAAPGTRCCDDIAAWPGTAIDQPRVLRRGLAPSRRRAMVEQLAPAEVHLVVTAREPLGLFTASWQESIKNRDTTPMADYSRDRGRRPRRRLELAHARRTPGARALVAGVPARAGARAAAAGPDAPRARRSGTGSPRSSASTPTPST